MKINEIRNNTNIKYFSVKQKQENNSTSPIKPAYTHKMALYNYQATFIPFMGRAKQSNISNEFDSITKQRIEAYEKLLSEYYNGRYGSENYKQLELDLKKLSSSKEKLQDKFSIDDRVKIVKNKKYQGESLYTKGYINWEKVGWDNLLKDKPLNFELANKDDLLAFWHAAGLAEAHDNWWVRRYNPTNRKVPLATGHNLVKDSRREKYAERLKNLNKIPLNSPQYPYLDKPIINPETGKLNIELIILDTETTGLKIHKKKGKSKKFQELNKDIDKIVQLGALKTDKNGNIVESTAINQLINPMKPIPVDASNVHHIYDKDVANAPIIEEVLPDFINKYVSQKPIVAYNAQYDITLLDNAIEEYNKRNNKKLTNPQIEMVLDPLILMQRIHPFIGASKKQTDQYRYFFGKDLEGAHDALADVKATTDILKYAIYYMNRRFTPTANHPSLTLRDVLKFQWEKNIDGLGVKLNHYGFDETKKFDKSYVIETFGVYNLPEGYKFKGEPKQGKIYEELNDIEKIKDQIGEDNFKILQDGLMNRLYKERGNFRKALTTFDIKPYGNMNKEEMIDFIIKNTLKYQHLDFVNMWMKNCRFEDIMDGNDLPDIKILKQLAKENRLTKKTAQPSPYTEFGVSVEEALNRDQV